VLTIQRTLERQGRKEECVYREFRTSPLEEGTVDDITSYLKKRAKLYYDGPAPSLLILDEIQSFYKPLLKKYPIEQIPQKLADVVADLSR